MDRRYIVIKKKVYSSECSGCIYFGTTRCKGEDAMKCIDKESDQSKYTFYIYSYAEGLTRLKII